MPVLEVFYMRASPPSYAVLALLKHTKTPYKATELDYFGGQQFTEEHAKRNPQKEVPVIQDGDYILCESVAILQYIADAYGKGLPDLYPSDPKRRGTINQRLAFNLCNLYPSVSMYTFGDVFGAPSTDQIKSKALRSLSVFETILKDQGTKFAAGDKKFQRNSPLLTSVFCKQRFAWRLPTLIFRPTHSSPSGTKRAKRKGPCGKISRPFAMTCTFS
ncbi:glutathione S-transferase 1-like isoform X2 [Neocloeon triangulifer]|uniref:glutathione S-transferase 1-like isoform X2 n=1 Tax=Neocloeon triangulifer TaxID=2078957 RepID=UPI00286F169C|nr:glutathione S-transferase 1-like isoform X2 [Neocloeon triangulifer]